MQTVGHQSDPWWKFFFYGFAIGTAVGPLVTLRLQYNIFRFARGTESFPERPKRGSISSTVVPI